MIRAWSRVPNETKVTSVTIILVAVCMAAAYTGGLVSHAPTITRTRTVTLSPRQAVSRMSAAELVTALGTPTQSQNESGGIVCDFWQSHAVEVCYKP